jgi:hypothetical protein
VTYNDRKIANLKLIYRTETTEKAAKWHDALRANGDSLAAGRNGGHSVLLLTREQLELANERAI